MALFTGKGDGGTTKAFGENQPRISKTAALPEALGALDELNSFLGLAYARASALGAPAAPAARFSIPRIVRETQESLFILQAETAGADKRISRALVEETEALVNAIEAEIPPIVSFSIAGGTELSALLDVARTIARRMERRLVLAHESGARALSPEARAYANRLSSLLFALARLANHEAGVAEVNPRY